ncbi:pollen-specific leucine-rich repeat extensin-like protein 3 [Impatiens glandulifera]|uniref:pollen-specific leucine-rich repeat extensin-like protein 3 n=1 Tax=Impatiens glandulifera TaxID=253017 RepID=UPI001FB0F605|nr:pollen-specific leucine-rich repeat extensin-like protein 3 [Impatiens glandulifera]
MMFICSMQCSPHCVSYLLRKRALYDDMSRLLLQFYQTLFMKLMIDVLMMMIQVFLVCFRYTCCGGYMPCSGKCGERKCPEFCLCTEVFLCFPNSVATTRFMMQDEFNIQTTQCDNCIIGFMFCLQQLACIFSLAACLTGIDELEEASQLLSCLSDLVYCSVCSCMQTQHKVELDKRDGKFGPRPIMAPPSPQHMSRIDQQPYPPPPSGYPQPPSGYPSPPSSGYPPPPSSAYPPPPPPHQQMYGYPSQPHPYAYPPPAPSGYPPAPAPGYPAHSPGYPTQSPPGYPTQSPPGYPSQSPPGYAPQPPPHSPGYSAHSSPHSSGYAPQPPPHSPGYAPQPPPHSPGYAPQPPGYPQLSPGYPGPSADHPPQAPYPPKSDSK